MDIVIEEYVAQFQKPFATELAEAVFCHYFDRRKHYGEPMPDPEELATKVGRFIAEQYIEAQL